MSDQNFQDRLNRIATAEPSEGQRRKHTQSQAGRSLQGKLKLGKLFLGALLMMCGVQAIKAANTGYDRLVEADSPGTILVLAVAGIASLLIGCVVMYRAVNASRQPLAAPAEVVVTPPSSGSRLVCAAFGLLIGGLACLLLGAAAQISNQAEDAESTRAFVNGSGVFLVGSSVTMIVLGLIGIFSRFRALRRMPIYYIVGAAIVFVLIQMWIISPVEVLGIKDSL